MFNTKATRYKGRTDMRFDLIDLKLFLNIVEAGSITGGAELGHMALASASARVRGMEEELGVPLLERGRRGVQPTDAGWTLVGHARAVLRQVVDMKGALGEFARGIKTQIRLPCNTAALTEFLPESLGAFLALHPQIDIELQEYPSAEIVRLIMAGKADVGIVADSIDRAQLESRLFRVDQLVAVVPRHHPLATAQTVNFSDLLGYPFVGLLKGSALQDHLDNHAERLGTRISYRVRLHDFDALCHLVEENVGIGVISETSAVRCSQKMAIHHIRLTEPWARRQLVFCMKDFDALPYHTQELIKGLSGSLND